MGKIENTKMKKNNTLLILLAAAGGAAYYFRKDLKKLLYPGQTTTAKDQTNTGKGKTADTAKDTTVLDLPVELVQQLQKALGVVTSGQFDQKTKEILAKYIQTKPTATNLPAMARIVDVTRRAVRKLASLQNASAMFKERAIRSIQAEFTKIGRYNIYEFVAPNFKDYTGKNLNEVFPSVTDIY